MLSGIKCWSLVPMFRVSAELSPVIDPTIKQHDKSIGKNEGLLLKRIFRCQLVQTKYERRVPCGPASFAGPAHTALARLPSAQPRMKVRGIHRGSKSRIYHSLTLLRNQATSAKHTHHRHFKT